MHESSSISENRTGSGHIGVLFGLISFLAPYKQRIFVAALALMTGALGVLGFGLVLRIVIDQGFASGEAAALNQALLLLLGVVITISFAVAARVYLVTWIGERVVADLRNAVFKRVLQLDPAFFETTRTGEVISRLTTDTSLIQVVVGSTLAIAVRNVLLFAGGLTMLIITSPKLTFWVLAGVPMVVLPVWILGRRVRRLSRQAQDRVADISAYIDETLYGIRTVQAFCHEVIDRKRYRNQVENAFNAAIARTWFSALLSGIAMLLMFTAVSLVLWAGGHDVLSGQMSSGQLAAFVFYAVLLAGTVSALSEIAGDLFRAAGAAERLMELLNTQPAITAPPNPVSLTMPVQGRVRFEHVSFRYPSRPDHYALDKVSLTLKPGEKVALVGPSGAGKSTILQLLLRFYDPQAGVIYFDDTDIRKVIPQDLRAQIALVPQDPVIFGTTAWENIAYGMQDVSEQQVLKAAEAAYASEFLQALPQGFDTYLGERGVRLSGGQRQRIAIARAILRDPALLLLDEATSALDAESEQWVQRALERLMQQRTSLVIAHRLATVRRVDRILVVDAGRIVASGNHDTLVAEGGLYARLAQLQFRDAA